MSNFESLCRAMCANAQAAAATARRFCLSLGTKETQGSIHAAVVLPIDMILDGTREMIYLFGSLSCYSRTF